MQKPNPSLLPASQPPFVLLLTRPEAEAFKASYCRRVAPAIPPTYPLSFGVARSLSISLSPGPKPSTAASFPFVLQPTKREAIFPVHKLQTPVNPPHHPETTIMNGIERRQDSLKRRWDEDGGPCYRAIPFPMRLTPGHVGAAATAPSALPTSSTSRKLLRFSPLDDETALAVVPPVTVVFEGRSIGHRIHLQNHASYESLAAALRRMFVDTDIGCERCAGKGEASGPSSLDLSNAVPGHIVAYEDMEDDLLLAGDLKWDDFVRVAKRIRILPAKASRRKHCGGAAAV